MTRLVALGVSVGWTKAKSFGCAELVDSVRDFSVTSETDVVLSIGPLGRVDPLDVNRPFGRLEYSPLVEHYVRTSDDLFVLGVSELVSDLAVWCVTNENTFPGSQFDFSTVVFRYEGIGIASENPQFVIIRLTSGP